VGTKVSQSDSRVLDRVIVQVPVYRLEQVGRDVPCDALLPILLIETEVGEVATRLSVVLRILRVSEHINHKFDSLVGGRGLVTIEYFRNMS
jgi:hypothetical protein